MVRASNDFIDRYLYVGGLIAQGAGYHGEVGGGLLDLRRDARDENASVFDYRHNL